MSKSANDLPILTNDERLKLQELLCTLAPLIDDLTEEATGQCLPFILLTWDGNGTFHASNVDKDFASQVMRMQLDRWSKQQDVLPTIARQH
ncbi:hypothetical protein [Paracoccus sp. AK26]|uniref:hypothetical protein n=1 Tax=Paracoccus sp. AK26 TaxID=2589076 RepID=UPI001428728C|nr:hypothetical protein [Paracoccus sp. AK26]QIR85036.1 hypothetical protein FIU66_07335 [Paracoccus sp. AK26]